MFTVKQKKSYYTFKLQQRTGLQGLFVHSIFRVSGSIPRHQSTTSTTLTVAWSRKQKEEFEFPAFLTPTRTRRHRLFSYRQLSA